jgi:hypothetical protein
MLQIGFVRGARALIRIVFVLPQRNIGSLPAFVSQATGALDSLIFTVREKTITVKVAA